MKCSLYLIYIIKFHFQGHSGTFNFLLYGHLYLNSLFLSTILTYHWIEDLENEILLFKLGIRNNSSVVKFFTLFCKKVGLFSGSDINCYDKDTT